MAHLVTEPLGLRNTVPDAYAEIVPFRTAYYQRSADGRLENAPAVDNSDVWPAGGYLSTAEDLARFGYAVVEGDFLSRESREIMLTPPRENVDEGEPFGLGWQLEERDGHAIAGHDGSHVGAIARLRVYRGTGVSVAALVNLSIDTENGVERALSDLVHEMAMAFVEPAR